MALFVYVTDQCRDDANVHSIKAEIQLFKERVERTQSTSLFDPFPPPYLVKKKIGGKQKRLVAERRAVGDHAVIVFLAVLIRGSRVYQDGFAKEPVAYGRQHLNLASDDEIARYVDERTRTQPPPPKATPNDIEYSFLYSAFSHHQDASADGFVWETAEWVSQVSQERISKQLALLYQPCLEALDKQPGLHFLPVESKSNWGVWALRREEHLLLLCPATDKTAEHAKECAKKIAKELEDKGADAIRQFSRRAYPSLILADDELWIDLEKEPVANMALSPEESEVLQSARRSEHAFPLFVNGRAGSGKSTILQYLFADLLFFYLAKCQGSQMKPPLYLTSNGELLRVARTFVERLLRSEASFREQSGADLAQDHKEVLDGAFRAFQPHLLSLVPSEERAKRFNRPSHVNYARFRRMWMERFGQDRRSLKECGPDLSWHVIRSYIKGMSSETFLEPDDYAQLPDNQITVTHDAFEVVYDKVWTGWYQPQLEDQSLWDDQDLTRYVLDEDLAQSLYPSVVCDEAQDFTRLELELLLRLNLFSQRALQPNDIYRVQFAFAGDQFQTLNPTGFRWDAIKSSFVEKFVFELDPARRSGSVDLNYRELQYNYRSTHSIVKFGNHIQAMRAALFQIPDLKPQTPWTTELLSFPVVYFRANDGDFWKYFRANSGFVIIVPCAEGEEAQYVKNDPVLSRYVDIEDGVPVNVLSSARAKGCEYPAVMVYGFGSAIDIDLLSELGPNERETLRSPDTSLPTQYFLNRLYVAVSRPKGRLIIVDTDEGFSRLWKCVQEEDAEMFMLERIKHGRLVWGDQIQGMALGDPEQLTRESAGDPIENARTFETDGFARQDSFLLRQAALAYRNAGDITKWKECNARALEADAEWSKAGEAYCDAGFALDGVRCLWRAGRPGWALLCERLSQFPQIENEIEFTCARAIESQAEPEAIARILEQLANRLSDETFIESCVGEPVWKEALHALMRVLVQRKTSEQVPEDLWSRMAVSLSRIKKKGVSISGSEAGGHVFYFARRFTEAIELWDAVGSKPEGYHLASASVMPYPDRVIPLGKLGSTVDVAEGYLQSPDLRLSREQAEVVADALTKFGRLDDAVKVAWTGGVVAPMLRIARAAFSAEDMSAVSQGLHAWMILLIRQQQWDSVMRFLSSRDFTPSEEWNTSEPKAFVRLEANALRVTLVKALARSDDLPIASKNVQRIISRFLKQYLRMKESTKIDRLTIPEAGAALERAGRFTDQLGFYTAVQQGKFSETEIEFARQRRLVCQQRQANHERAQGQTTKASNMEHDIREKLKVLRIGSLDELGQFPSLPPLSMPARAPVRKTPNPDMPQPTSVSVSVERDKSPKADTPEEVVLTIGPMRLEISRKLHRCNLTHTDHDGDGIREDERSAVRWGGELQEARRVTLAVRAVECHDSLSQ